MLDDHLTFLCVLAEQQGVYAGQCAVFYICVLPIASAQILCDCEPALSCAEEDKADIFYQAHALCLPYYKPTYEQHGHQGAIGHTGETGEPYVALTEEQRSTLLQIAVLNAHSAMRVANSLFFQTPPSR